MHPRLATTLDAAADGAIALPPITWEGVAWGPVILFTGYLLGRVLGWATRGALLWQGRSTSASAMFAALIRWVVTLLTFAAAMTVVFPSVRPVNALGGIGALSNAAGIAQTVSLTSTAVRTFDGRLVFNPNSVVHSEVVTVQTGFEHVRSTISVDIADSADLDAAAVAVRAVLGGLAEAGVRTGSDVVVVEAGPRLLDAVDRSGLA